MPDHDVQEDLDALAVELGRSLTIDSTDGELVAYSAQNEDADEARVSTILLRHVSPEIRRWQRRHTGDRVDGPVAVPANLDLGMSARLCVPLIHDEQTVGLLWMVHSGDDLGVDERRVLDRRTASLARALARPASSSSLPTSPGHEVDAAVGRLFEDVDTASFDRLVVAVPELLDRDVRVVAVIAGDVGRGSRPLRPAEHSAMSGVMRPLLRRQPGYVGTHVTMGHALAIVQPEIDEPDAGRLLDEIDRVVDRCLAAGAAHVLGVSDGIALQPRTIRQARSRALCAAELAMVDPVLDRRSYYSRLGAYRYLTEPHQVTDAVLAPLDAAGSSSPMLLETLETFLDLAGDVQAVARRLRLHRSSLYYRLDRITRLLDVDLSRGMDRLELHLALKHRRAGLRATDPGAHDVR